MIRNAFGAWPLLNARMIDVVAPLTAEQLALTNGADRWPLWATIGHAACQRVFWLCDFANEPRSGATPFPNAKWECPGDEDLDHPLSGEQLAEALRQTYVIVERVLDTWTSSSLDDVIDHTDWDEQWRHTRGFVINRVYTHDVWHAAEANEILSAASLPLIDAWD